MSASLKPLVTTGIALVGASVIAVSPLAPPPDPLRTESRDFQLTAVIPDEVRNLVAGLGQGFGVAGGAAVALGLVAPQLPLWPAYLILQGVPPDEAIAAVSGVALAATTAALLGPVAGLIIGIPPPLGGPNGIGEQIIAPPIQFISDLALELIGDTGPFLPANSFPVPEGPLRDLTDPIYQIQVGFVATVDGLSRLLGATPAGVIDGINAISEGADPVQVTRALAYGAVAGVFGDPEVPNSFGALTPLTRALVFNLPEPLGGGGGVVDEARVVFDETVVAPIRNALRPTTGLQMQQRITETPVEQSGQNVNEVPGANNLVRLDTPKENRNRPLLNILRNSSKATPGEGAVTDSKPGQRARNVVKAVTDGISDSVQRISNAIKKVTNRDRDDEKDSATDNEPE